MSNPISIDLRDEPNDTQPMTDDQFDRHAQSVQEAVGDARLLSTVADRRSAKVSLQIASQRLAALLGAMALVVGFTVAQPADHAAAAVIPLTQPVKVVLAGPTATLTTQVVATAPTTAHGLGRWIAVSAPINGVQQRVGYGSSATAVVPVKVTLPTSAFVVGRSTWMTRDLGDGRLSPLVVDARRGSRFAGSSVVAAMPGYLLVTARVQHWKASAGVWVPSQSSPVVVQSFNGRSWVNLATLTTGVDGAVFGAVMGVDGVQRYRLVRPDGAAVWGAATAPVLVDASPTFDY